MDQVRVGKYIASLRKQASLTQEELGEKLGVTNKTVSRWENGLLAGEKIADEDFRQKAEENIIEVATSSAFSFEDRKVYFKRKWRKEHIALFVILGLILIASAVIPLIIDKLWLISFLSLGR